MALYPHQLLEICRPANTFGNPPETCGQLRFDSRLVQPGDIFVAIRGPLSDGHDYIGMAVERGASVIIAETEATAAVWWLQTPSTNRLATPLALAEQGHPEKQMKFVGVTGTNGKTTVTTLVWQVLTQLGYTTGLIGTAGKQIGMQLAESQLTTPGPLELAADLAAMRDAGCHVVAMEVSSHALMQFRTEGISFDVACFTNLTLDHLDYHGSMAAYAAAKSHLFTGLNSDAVCVINTEDPHWREVTGNTRAKREEFSFGDNGRFRILENSASGMALDLVCNIVQSPLSGRFNAQNVAAAWLICRSLGIDAVSLASAFTSATGAPGRMERVSAELNEPVVYVDYAHTPDALENVLSTLAELKGNGKLHVVFGCGGNRDRSKRPQMAAIAAKNADFVYITSDNPRDEEPSDIIREAAAGLPAGFDAVLETDRVKAIFMAVSAATPSDLVLIAGKGHETYQEIRGVRYPMDDRQTAREALAARPDIQEA